jgi:dihydroorotase/N-acyl-D-amino-acid deacylase
VSASKEGIVEFDIIIRGGLLIDGIGAEARPADVGIQGDRIADIGDLTEAETRTSLDAGGMAVSPGFIDAHTHSDCTCFLPDEHEVVKTAALLQGVTTEVCGNCGFSPFPVLPATRDQTIRLVKPLLQIPPRDWSTFDEYADRVEEQGVHANLAPLVGHGSLRVAVMGFDQRSPSADELRSMKRLLEETLEQGAFGFSSGLIYAPGQYADTAELVELTAVAARFGRPYCTHMRGEADLVMRSMREALEIGRASGAALHISHHKVAGRANWGRTHETLALLDDARRTGQDVTCDVYPYTAGSTILHAILPGWAQAGGIGAMLERLRDRASRDRITHDLEEPSDTWENMVRAAGWDRITLATCPGHPEYEGHTIAELAENSGKSAADTAYDLILEERGAATMIIHHMHEDDVRRVIAYDGATIGSDGIPAPGKPHPRWAGTFARILGRYTREEGLLSLTDAIHKMTGMTAERFGLTDRGHIAPGKAADLVVFDPAGIADRATYDDPLQTAAGVRHVVVNGIPVVVNGALTGSKPGRVVRAR